MAEQSRHSSAGDLRGPENRTPGRLGQAIGLGQSILFAAILLLPAIGLEFGPVIGPASAAARCASMGDNAYAIDVRVEIPEIHLDRTHNRSDLTKMADLGHRAKHLGLMLSELEIRNLANYQAIKSGDRYCFWVDDIEVDLIYTALDVYIAKEYGPPSCAYRVILEHEKQHVAVLREHAERYTPDVRKALTSLLIPDPKHPALVDSTEAAEQKIEALFQELLSPIFERMQVSIDQAQAALDTPEAYRQVYDSCDDW